MLTDFTNWLVEQITQFFVDLWQFVKDAAVNVFDLLTQAVVAAISAIPVPDFLANGLGPLYLNLDPGIRYFLNIMSLPAGLALIGAGFAFRMLRKIVTLGQW